MLFNVDAVHSFPACLMMSEARCIASFPWCCCVWCTAFRIGGVVDACPLLCTSLTYRVHERLVVWHLPVHCVTSHSSQLDLHLNISTPPGRPPQTTYRLLSLLFASLRTAFAYVPQLISAPCLPQIKLLLGKLVVDRMGLDQATAHVVLAGVEQRCNAIIRLTHEDRADHYCSIVAAIPSGQPC